MLASIFSPTLLGVTNELSCQAVKGLYRDAACCGADGSTPVDACEDVQFQTSTHVTRNVDYDSATARFKSKKYIQDSPLLKAKWMQSYGGSETMFPSCSGVCYNNFLLGEIHKTYPNLSTSLLNVPTTVPTKTLDDGSTFNWMQGLTCEEEAQMETNTTSISMFGDINTWASSFYVIQCPFYSSPFSGFEALGDTVFRNGMLYVGGGTPVVYRFQPSKGWGLDVQPEAATFYSGDLLPNVNDPTHPKKLDLFRSRNGGPGRGIMGVDDTEVCQAGDIGPFSYHAANGRYLVPSELGKVRYEWDSGMDGEYMPANSIGIVCYPATFQDGDAPTHVYRLAPSRIHSVIFPFFQSTFGVSSNSSKYSGYHYNPRDMQLTDSHIYLTYMMSVDGVRTNSVHFVVRIVRATGEYFVSKTNLEGYFHNGLNMTMANGYGSGRSWHMTVNEHGVYTMNSVGSNTPPWRVNRWPIDFADGADLIGMTQVPFDATQPTLAGFYGTNEMASMDGKVYFPVQGMMFVDADFGFLTHTATRIPLPTPSYLSLYRNGRWTSINYGIVAKGGKVHYLMGATRDFDIFGPQYDKYGLNEDERDLVRLAHAHDIEWVVYTVDPSSGSVVNTAPVVTEQADGCEGFSIDDEGRYAYLVCGGNLRSSWDAMDTNPISQIRRIDLHQGTLAATATTSMKDAEVTVATELEHTTRKTRVGYDGLYSSSSGNGVRNVHVNTTDLAMVHVDRAGENVYLGANIANMGVPQDVVGPPTTQKNNLVIGVSTGNLVHGMENNLIIGNNMENINRDFEPGQAIVNPVDILRAESEAAKLVASESPKFAFRHSPAKGIFALGMNGKAMLRGNFDTGTINIPSLRHLSETLDAVNANSFASSENVLFSRLNIVQTLNKNQEADGVQYLLDKIGKLETSVCKLKGGTDESCAPAPQFEFKLHAFIDVQAESAAEASWKLMRRNADGSTTDVIRYTHDGTRYKLYLEEPFDTKVTYDGSAIPFTYNGLPTPVHQRLSKLLFEGTLPVGNYTLLAKDSAGNGWSQGGIGPWDHINANGLYMESNFVRKEIRMDKQYDADRYSSNPNHELIRWNLTVEQLTEQSLDVTFPFEAEGCGDVPGLKVPAVGAESCADWVAWTEGQTGGFAYMSGTCDRTFAAVSEQVDPFGGMTLPGNCKPGDLVKTCCAQSCQHQPEDKNEYFGSILAFYGGSFSTCEKYVPSALSFGQDDCTKTLGTLYSEWSGFGVRFEWDESKWSEDDLFRSMCPVSCGCAS